MGVALGLPLALALGPLASAVFVEPASLPLAVFAADPEVDAAALAAGAGAALGEAAAAGAAAPGLATATAGAAAVAEPPADPDGALAAAPPLGAAALAAPAGAAAGPPVLAVAVPEVVLDDAVVVELALPVAEAPVEADPEVLSAPPAELDAAPPAAAAAAGAAALGLAAGAADVVSAGAAGAAGAATAADAAASAGAAATGLATVTVSGGGLAITVAVVATTGTVCTTGMFWTGRGSMRSEEKFTLRDNLESGLVLWIWIAAMLRIGVAGQRSFREIAEAGIQQPQNIPIVTPLYEQCRKAIRTGKKTDGSVVVWNDCDAFSGGNTVFGDLGAPLWLQSPNQSGMSLRTGYASRYGDGL